MQNADKVAATAVRQRFAEQHPDDWQILNKIGKDEVAVYFGSCDRVEDILHCLDVPVTMNPDAKKLEAKIIFVNCFGSYHQDLISHLARQVEASKWLVSSNWANGHLMAKAFPNKVQWTWRSTGD